MSESTSQDDSRSEADAPAVFILGTARSGTTLLRRILNEHPDLSVPGETHFVSKTLRWTRRDIRDGRITDWSRFREAVRANPYMDHLRPFFDDETPDVPHPRVSDVFHGMMSGYARSRGKSRWGEKSPPHIWFWRWIDELFPDARYLVISRDGRDVACSLTEKTWASRAPLANAARWKTEFYKVARLRRTLGARAHPIRYEDLVRDPEAVLRPACKFLSLPWEPAMLVRHTARRGPVHVDSVGRHRRVLSERALRRMDALIGPELRAAGGYEIRSEPLGWPEKCWVHVRARVGLARELLRKSVWSLPDSPDEQDVRHAEAARRE